MNPFLKKINLSFNHFDPRLFVTSQWQVNKNIPNKTYLIYRWILALYFTFVIILSLITAENDMNLILYPIFLTNWNVILNGVSSVFTAVTVTQYYNKVIKLDNDTNLMTNSLKFSWLLSSLSVVISSSLSIIYWPLIYTGRDKGVNDALTHAGNAIILVLDTFVKANPPRYGHFIYQLIFGFIYAVFSIIYTMCGGINRDRENFIYSVLDWRNNTGSACIFALLTLLFVSFIHFVYTALIQLRIKLFEKFYSQESGTTVSSDIGIDNLAHQV